MGEPIQQARAAAERAAKLAPHDSHASGANGDGQRVQFIQVAVRDDRVDFRVRDDVRKIFPWHIAGTENKPPREAVELDQRQGCRELIACRDKNGSTGTKLPLKKETNKANAFTADIEKWGVAGYGQWIIGQELRSH
jgi:hypothetical protein